MIALNAFLFWAILSAIFMAGFLTCSLLCINDLRPRLTQTPEEAAKDESHSQMREEQPSAEEIAAARGAATPREDGACSTSSGCGHCPIFAHCHGYEPGDGPRRRYAHTWLLAHGLPIEEPPK